MNRSTLWLGCSLAASALAVFVPHDAAACGGCFHPPTQTASDITDERMLLVASTAQSTLYDQIRYAGSPKSFAWVLPIHGTVDVGLSADVLFDSIDALTATQIVPPESNCPLPPGCFYGPSANAGAAFGGDDASSAPAVTVTKAENVGPYATVQLHATDSSALDTWLTQNGFDIPADVVPVINQYVSEGFDFLAMKLRPDQGVQSMRPVRVTTTGGSLTLPLRMAAVGTGATVGITIWVVSDGRYEPQNFPFFHIDDSALVWDFSTSLSNYTTLRAQNEANLGGKGWEIESSLALNQQLITSVILSGGQYYGGQGGGGFGGVAVSAPSDAANDYLPVGSPDADAAAYQSAEDVRTADIAALFKGLSGSNVRVTRMRSDITHASMTKDFVLQASADQSELSNVRTVTKSVNLVCQTYPGCSSYGASGATSGSSTSTPTGGSSRGPSPAAAEGPGTGPSKGGAAGCAASPQSPGGTAASLGTVFGVFGLVLVRIVRTRRRSSRRSA